MGLWLFSEIRRMWSWLADRVWIVWAAGLLAAACALAIWAAGCGTEAPRSIRMGPRGTRQPKPMQGYRMNTCNTAATMYLRLSRDEYTQDDVRLVVGMHRGYPHSWVQVGGEYLLDPEHRHTPLRLEEAELYEPWAYYELEPGMPPEAGKRGGK